MNHLHRLNSTLDACLEFARGDYARAYYDKISTIPPEKRSPQTIAARQANTAVLEGNILGVAKNFKDQFGEKMPLKTAQKQLKNSRSWHAKNLKALRKIHK